MVDMMCDCRFCARAEVRDEAFDRSQTRTSHGQAKSLTSDNKTATTVDMPTELALLVLAAKRGPHNEERFKHVSELAHPLETASLNLAHRSSHPPGLRIAGALLQHHLPLPPHLPQLLPAHSPQPAPQQGLSWPSACARWACC